MSAPVRSGHPLPRRGKSVGRSVNRGFMGGHYNGSTGDWSALEFKICNEES